MDIGDNMRPLWPKQYGCIWPSHHDPPAKNGQAVIFFFDRIVRGFISEISILGTVLGTSVHYQAINQFAILQYMASAAFLTQVMVTIEGQGMLVK